jgi:sugar lactone lactonase YvrE
MREALAKLEDWGFGGLAEFYFYTKGRDMRRAARGKRLGQGWLAALLAGAMLLLTAGLAQAAWVNGQAATVVLGQGDFTSNTPGVTQSGMFGPINACTDRETGKVFVIDYVNHRVLRFSRSNAELNGANAEAVFGQSDFTGNTSGRSASKLNMPFGCAIADSGDLWISDSVNGRVLLYRDAANKPTVGAEADLVLGQADFTSYSSSTDQSTMTASVYGVAVSPDGTTLWASSAGQNRVLRWDNPSQLSNGAPANGVLGQESFTTTNAIGSLAPVADLPSPTATSLGYPTGLALDMDGNLFVSDQNYRRILRYDAAKSKANGAAANGVLGVTDFTTAGVGSCTSATFGLVYSLVIASDGRLYAAVYDQNRVLIFHSPAGKANGASADYVLGQSDFLSSAGALTAAGLEGPMGLGFNAWSGRLYVGDFSNNRVLGYENPELQRNTVPALGVWGLAFFAGLLLVLGRAPWRTIRA